MRKAIFILLGLGFIIQSCDSDNFKFETDKISNSFKHTSSWAVPIVNASITLEELLPQDEETQRHLIIDEDGFITVVTDSDLGTISAKNFFKYNLPTNINQDILPIPVIIPIKYHVKPSDFVTGLNNMESAQGFYCANPQIELEIKNYWSVPMRIKFEKTYYYKESNSIAIPIESRPNINDWKWNNIEMPKSPNIVASTRFKLNKDNSNFHEVIAKLPHHISFGAYLELQEGISLPQTYDIPINTSDSILVHVKVPMEVKMTNVALTDTVKLDLGSDMNQENKDMVKFIKLNMLFNNNFPITADIKMYITDDFYHITDSINNEDISIKAGNSQAGKSKEVIVLDTKKIKHLLDAKHLILKLRLNSEGKTVKLYSTNSLDVKFGALVKLEYEN